MASNERIKKYLDAGTVLGQVTRARAEEIVRELVSAGDIQREQAQEWVDNLVERSRKTSEQILDLVRNEVATQLSKIDASSLETLAGQVADLLKRSAEAGRSATAGAAAQASKGAKAARNVAEKVAPSGVKKKVAAKKAAAKTAAKKATAKKASAAKKAAPTKKAAVKKAAAAKKAPAKKAPATEKAPPRRRRPRALPGRTAELWLPPAARYGARPPRPRRQPERGPGSHRRRHRPGGRDTGREGRPPGRTRRAGHAARASGPLRQPRRAEARRRPHAVLGRSPRQARARCGCVHRRVHRLPPAAGGEPASTPSTSGTGSSTSACATTGGSRSSNGSMCARSPRSGCAERPLVRGLLADHGRPVFHLAGHGAPGTLRPAGPTRR